MEIRCIHTEDELAALAPQWNALAAGVPFRTWDWLSAWWRHYGGRDRPEAGAELCTLCVYSPAGALVGIAPWYRCRNGHTSGVLRFLGTGQACSEYLTVLCRPGDEAQVSVALADWLCRQSSAARETIDKYAWRRLELTAVDGHDMAVGRLVDELGARGAVAHCRPGADCWRVPLPSTWDEYLGGLSKSHRKQLRQLQRRWFETGRARLHRVSAETELDGAWPILVDLHQRRRQSLGEPGLFSSRQFAQFHQQAARLLLRSGRLRLCWLELDARPVAAEYQLAGDGVVYAYQAGVEPSALADEPGRLITMATLRAAIEEGFHTFDLLRGNEPYKAHWRGVRHPTLELRVWPGTPAGRIERSAWVAGANVRRWLRRGAGLAASWLPGTNRPAARSGGGAARGNGFAIDETPGGNSGVKASCGSDVF